MRISDWSSDVCSTDLDLADPIERFRAIMHFFARFTIEQAPERIFEMEPAFHLDFFRSHFDRHKAAVRDALEPVLDHFDALAGSPIDRDGFVETLVRLQIRSEEHTSELQSLMRIS